MALVPSGVRAHSVAAYVRSGLPDDDLCADLDAIVEVDHVRVVETDASRRDGVPDRLRLVCAVDAENRVAKISARAPRGLPSPPAMKRGR